MNRLALRLGVCGGLLAFAGNALVLFTRDPAFLDQTPQQVIQMSLVWFGFTALVGSVVGWGIWALNGVAEERRSARLATSEAGPQVDQLDASPSRVDLRAGDTERGAEQPGGVSRLPSRPEPGADAESFPPDATAQAVRQALREDAG